MSEKTVLGTIPVEGAQRDAVYVAAHLFLLT